MDVEHGDIILHLEGQATDKGLYQALHQATSLAIVGEVRLATTLLALKKVRKD
jgi:hypothetical protein